MAPPEGTDFGYLKASIENIDKRLDALTATVERHSTMTAEELKSVRAELSEYAGHWKAVRVMGALILALLVAIKTGDTAPLKALFGASG